MQKPQASTNLENLGKCLQPIVVVAHYPSRWAAVGRIWPSCSGHLLLFYTWPPRASAWLPKPWLCLFLGVLVVITAGDTGKKPSVGPTTPPSSWLCFPFPNNPALFLQECIDWKQGLLNVFPWGKESLPTYKGLTSKKGIEENFLFTKSTAGKKILID